MEEDVINTPHVFRGTRQVAMEPRLCQRTSTRKPGLIWVWTYMDLNNLGNVDVSMYR